jgi:glucose-6-phosphate isomerase
LYFCKFLVEKVLEVLEVLKASPLFARKSPFNQPGVEAYKKNMFALLDKPGYEAESAAIKARL